MNTASEQFVSDYLLVIENDEEAWRDLDSMARTEEFNIPTIAHKLREEWDDYVDQVATLAEREWGTTEPATLLIRQIMGGWGDTEFHKIATAICEGKE